ncbi:MAG: hypothetical protein KatS3mg102_0944 [Planctomycetota bacterium]|nr:MAG: hypothetical protein KatS3mg102_0944 [Planctomycetota bacterium]
MRVDAGIAEGDAIGVYYDPLLAKLIAHAPSREEALRRMRHALERTAVLGVRTNRAWLHRVLGHPEVLAGRFDNTFLERHAAQFAEPAAARAAREQKARAVAAVALALQRRERAAAGAPAQPRPPGLPAGWRLHRSEDQWVDLEALWPGGPTSAPPAPPPAPEPAPQAAARTERARPAPPGRVRYRWTGPQSWLLVPQESADGLVPPPEQGGWQVELLHAELEPGAAGSAALRALELEIDGQARRWLVAIKDERIWVQGGAAETELRVLPRLPAGGQGGADGTPGPGGAHLATAPMPGRVLRVLVEPGAVLEPHAPLVILESMKTELTVSAAHPGVVRAVLVQPGEQVQAGAPLVELDGGEGAPAAAPEQGAPAGAGGAAAAGP